VKIPVSHGHLEAALRDPFGELRGGAVFCHPHPIQGGTMHTKAVYRAARALNQAGLRTLRFNFRGVGYSTGTYDDGIGEEEDVRAALDWLGLGLPGSPIVVGGLSFGSMVGMKVGIADPRVVSMVALGTPIHVYDYSYLAETRKPILVVQGEHDEFGSGREVKEVLEDLGGHVRVQSVKGAGHLFENHLDELQEIIQDYFSHGAGGVALAGGLGTPGGTVL
jgi:alpha/beta superfamily hydrolase